MERMSCVIQVHHKNGTSSGTDRKIRQICLKYSLKDERKRLETLQIEGMANQSPIAVWLYIENLFHSVNTSDFVYPFFVRVLN